MNHENKFTVTRYENRSGVTSWRVSGWLHGVRIRKNFKSREEAAAEKAALELKAVQTTSGMRTALTLKILGFSGCNGRCQEKRLGTGE